MSSVINRATADRGWVCQMAASSSHLPDCPCMDPPAHHTIALLVLDMGANKIRQT